MDKYAMLTEDELAARLNRRDVKAYEEIYNRYWEVMYRFAFKLVRDSDQAKDITQDIFANLYTRLGVTDFLQTKIAAYLYISVRRNFINLTIRDKTKTNYLNSLRDYFDNGQYTTDEQVREKELMRQIEEEISRLPEHTRKIFEMSRKQYLTRKEIAAATDLPEEKVKKQLAKAVRVLRGRLGAFVFLHIMCAILWLNR